MNDQKECRICFETTDQNNMLSPCSCNGTMAYIHSFCLKNCIQSNDERICRICHQIWRGVTIVKKNKNFFDYLKEELHPWYFLISVPFVVSVMVSNIVLGTKYIIDNKAEFSTIEIAGVIFVFIIGGLFIIIYLLIVIQVVIHNYKIWSKVNYKTNLLIESQNPNPLNFV